MNNDSHSLLPWIEDIKKELRPSTVKIFLDQTVPTPLNTDWISIFLKENHKWNKTYIFLQQLWIVLTILLKSVRHAAQYSLFYVLFSVFSSCFLVPKIERVYQSVNIFCIFSFEIYVFKGRPQSWNYQKITHNINSQTITLGNRLSRHFLTISYHFLS